jgi:CO/xanthine dehydrogenase Mo-binding subunit
LNAKRNGPEFRFIGQPMPVVEDRRFVRGRGRYINDLELTGMLHLGVTSAPVAHARLISVDVSDALKVPGVVTVLTGEDIVKHMEPLPQEFYQVPVIKWYPLVVDKVRSAGEWVAAVVATSRAVAEDAAELVQFEYEELDPVVDPEAALLPGSPVLHEAHGSNLALHNSWTHGDVDGEFERAEHVSEYKFRWHRHSGVPIETFGAVASLQPNGILDVWASHQNPGIQQEMMDVLGLPSVRVNMDIDVGGSYGSKRGKKQMYLTAIASLVTQRPVKFIEDRIENMQAGDGHGPDRRYRVRVAAQRDGTVKALDIYAVEDIGSYPGRASINKPTTALTGPYRVNSVRYGGDLVMTCKTNQVPFRGAGQSPHNFALERVMDQLALELDIDPVEIRLRNYLRPEEFPWKTPSGSVYDSGDYQGAMELVVRQAGLDGLRAERDRGRREGRLVGIGIAGCVEPSSGSPRANLEGTRIEVDRSGRINVTIGFQSSGQSHETMIKQIMCEEFGVDAKDVFITRANGFGGIVGGATTASRMTLMLGGALRQTSQKVQDKLRALTAQALEADQADIVRDGLFYHVAGDPNARRELKELARIAYRSTASLPPGMEPGLVEDVVNPGPARKFGFASYAFDIHVNMVEIDPETFEIRFLRYVIVHDCGTVINPLVVDGFVYGGIGHGIGGALYEDFSYNEQGILQSATFMDYLIPTAAEIPEIELHTMETPSPLHPYGAKGTAEGSYMTAPAAVASAVEDALRPYGIFIDEIPITPTMLFDRVTAAAAGTPVRPAADGSA